VAENNPSARSPARKTIFVFSGQGSQYFQMGRELFEQSIIFRQWMQSLNEYALKHSGLSVIDEIYSTRAKTDVFDRTRLTHPAIFMIEYALAQCLMSFGVMPQMTLGTSMGSFAAAAVAGFIEVEDAMLAVMKQAIAFEACCEPGIMLAVLAQPSLFAQDFLRANSELAGVNFATHFAVSAPRESGAEIENALRNRGVSFQRLPVSFAFHSRWIDDAQAPFLSFMQSIRTRQPQLPLMCCEQVTTLSDLPADYFWRVVRQPIRFQEAIARLECEGAYRYIDVGPAGTLATFLKYGLPASSDSTTHAVITPYGNEMKNLSALCRDLQ
jgi:acyl transferase domain-containing protein